MRDPHSADANAQTPPDHPDTQVRVDLTSREFGVPERKLAPVEGYRVTAFEPPKGEITLTEPVMVQEGETTDEALQRALAEQTHDDVPKAAE